MIVAGEIHTGLLYHSHALTSDRARTLLRLAPGEPPRQWHRPIARTQSPPLLVGVDCGLPLGSRTGRGVGTVKTRAVLTGGHILQGSSFARVVPADEPRRLAWPHYLSRPGTIESLQPVTAALATGLLADTAGTDRLRLTGICDRTVNSVQRDAMLDHKVPLRSRRTRLRWVVDTTGTTPHGLHLAVKNRTDRTLLIGHPNATLETVTTLCEDIAYHDWLLTTVLTMMSRARIGAVDRRTSVSLLGPAVDHLLHLWMPAAHCDEAVRPRWHDLEIAPGFSRQWSSLVDRIRDQLTLAMLTGTRSAISSA